MRILSLKLRNFRCFPSLDLEFSEPLTLISGPNGIGKTSILEALHYTCYLRSFKSHTPKELININNTSNNASFSISANLLASSAFDTLQINFTNNKKSVKINQKPISSFKELYQLYKAVTITEDDLMLIKGAPSLRRTFIDQFLVLIDPSFAILLKRYRHILDNRNALLSSPRIDHDSYIIWTDQLLNTSYAIQNKRKEFLAQIEIEANNLIDYIFPHKSSVSITYQYARPYTTLFDYLNSQELLKDYPNLLNYEITNRRSAFGAHLDDFKITFQDLTCKNYASRGQQKLVIFLLKLAQIKLIDKYCDNSDYNSNNKAILLIDDFMTDFDEAKINTLLPLLTTLTSQVIITSPHSGLLDQKLLTLNAQIINL